MNNTLLLGLSNASDGINSAFYNSWNEFLVPELQLFLKAKLWLGHTIAVFFSEIGDNMYQVWQKVWELADFSRVFFSQDVLGNDSMLKIVALVFMLAFLALAVTMAIQMLMFSLTNGKQGRDWPKGILISLLLFIGVPALMPPMMNIAQNFGNAVNTASAKTPMTQLWKVNSISLVELANNEFNGFTDKNITDKSPFENDGIDPDSYKRNTVFQQTTLDDGFDKKVTKKVGKEVLENKAGIGKDKTKLDTGGWFAGKAMSEAYPLVKTNFFAITLGAIVYSIAIFFAIIEFITHIYKNAYYSLSMIYFAWRDLSGKKALEIAKMLEGSILGMALMPVGINLYFAWNQFAFNVIKSMGLNMWGATIMYIAVLIGGFKALMAGFSMIDEWTGMPSGQGQSAMSMIQNPLARGAGRMSGKAASVATGAAAGATGWAGRKAWDSKPSQAMRKKTNEAVDSAKQSAKSAVKNTATAGLDAVKKPFVGNKQNPDTNTRQDLERNPNEHDQSFNGKHDNPTNQGLNTNPHVDDSNSQGYQNTTDRSRIDDPNIQGTQSNPGSSYQDGKPGFDSVPVSSGSKIGEQNAGHSQRMNQKNGKIKGTELDKIQAKTSKPGTKTGHGVSLENPSVQQPRQGNGSGQASRFEKHATPNTSGKLTGTKQGKITDVKQPSVMTGAQATRVSNSHDRFEKNHHVVEQQKSYEPYNAQKDDVLKEITSQPDYDFKNYVDAYLKREQEWNRKHPRP